ncbi:polyketide synthase [Kitasatospora xanthocidica]|uniref:type I polyketide synthase n=1 Tax=Kitasatospora xanthocidica TaxID=83382 RepID=UPI00167B3628|nr:type I polyketide synthase [Kitasatospora xanthocidica]GHF63526.1 polyketide synthase [Kitasatospora xanthocidica]
MNAQPDLPDAAETDGRVAVVGLAGRFPGADSVDALWELLAAGTEAISRFGPEELRAAGVPQAEAGKPGYVAAKGVLADVAGFDSQLFGYNALEASVIDPQQRLFLECAWEALEDAGCDPDRAPGPIAVYAGSLLSTYLIHNLLPRTDLRDSLGVPMLFQGNQPDQLAARAAYKLNLRGPAVSVQTACSTSLVAVHLAVQSLLSEECDLALAGGVTVTVPHRSGYLPVPGGIESPDGHCRPFGAEAAGTVFGNGAGVVVLKRLADALADGDRVHAVVLGSAVNNDGANKAGYTAPGVAGQTAVIREALSVAGVAPDSIGYVEAHGTGTPIGDPIEVEALTAAFRAEQDAEPPTTAGWCGLGSVKSNLGHLDTAAGVTGLIKTILTVREGRIPASLHAESVNPGLGLADSPFFVPSALTDWPVAGGPRRAAVSAFGIGGTNAHVVLEQAPDPAARASADAPAALPVALPLSARTGSALDTAAERLADDLAAHPDRPLADVARTLRTGRRQLVQRRVVVAKSTAEAVAALRGGGRRESVRARAGQGAAPVAFLLPGQGAQYPGMALGLHRSHPVFRTALDEAAELLRPHLGLDLVDLLRDGDTDLLRRSSITQPAVLAVGHATAALWRHWGVRPAALLGHSLGEYTAALLSGVLDLPEALALVAARGRLMEETAPGAMLAVPLDEPAAAELAARHGLDLAAVNGPAAAVLSGTAEAAGRAAAELGERGLRGLPLPVDRAFHSALCAPAAERFAAELAGVTLREPTVPFLSNLTGDWITPEQATDPGYWTRQMLSPVRFHNGLTRLAALDERLVLVETGPGSVLTDLVRSAAEGDGLRLAQPPLPTRGRRGPEDEPASAVLALGSLWTHGVPVDWEPPAATARPATLPGYPFERLPHWIEPTPPGHAPATALPVAELDAVHATIAWRPLAEPAGEDPLAGRRQTWLVLLDRAATAQPLVDLLTARGQIVTTVQPGPGYRRVRRGVYELDPADPAQYAKLLADLRALVRTPTAVLYGWGLDETADETDGYFGLVNLARAMSAESVVHEVRLGVLTAGAFPAAPGERPRPAAALLSGPVQVLGEEYRNLRCTQVDLAPGTALDEAAATAVVRAALTGPARLLALRGSTLLTRTVERAERPVPASPARVRAGSTWLITGGLGGIGLTLARSLARAGAARLVLIGRGAGDQSAATALDALREAGAEVLAVRADVTDAESLNRALDQARSAFGRIDGVIHAAGVPGGGSVELRSDDSMRAVLAPKTAGLRHLLDALQPGEAEVLVLCSSLATLIPTYGQADYAAANAYLGAVAEAEAARGERHAVAVDWDMWAQVGMASQAEVPEALRAFQADMLAGALTPEQGARAFAALLDGPPGRAVVARVGAAVVDGALRTSTAPGADQPRTAALPRPELATPYTAPATPTEERLAEIYAELLGLDRVGVEDDFLELGGHSLLAAQVAARLRAEFEVDVPARVFFEGGRIADLAVEIEDRIIAELEQQ